MTPAQYIKRLVLFALILKVTSHPTPYGSRLINFLDGSIGIGGGRRVHSDNNDHRHHQKNVETGSDSSLVEISFQPLRQLESVSAPPSSSLYSLTGKQFSDEDPPAPLASVPNLAAVLGHKQRKFQRHRQTNRRPLEEDQRGHHRRQRLPDEFLNERLSTVFSLSPAVNGLNEIFYPADEDDIDAAAAVGEFMLRDLQQSRASSGEQSAEEEGTTQKEKPTWKAVKRQQHPFSFGSAEAESLYGYLGDEANDKRNALAAFKRQKFKSHQTQFIPSISVGAMTSLGDFFKNLKNNVEFMEKGRLSGTEEQLLEGDHPISLLREELNSDGIKPTGTAAFLHAIRTYRPSQRIRSLVALNPEGYHGSQFLDPNYMWVGLGKRK